VANVLPKLSKNTKKSQLTMSKRIFAHVPYEDLLSNLEYVISRGINPEIFFPNESLDKVIPEQLSVLAGAFSERAIKCTIHAPFMDLSPGSPEKLLRDATLHRFFQILDVARILTPEVIVFHPGYDRWRYGDILDKWLGYSIETWQAVLERGAGLECIIAIENIFEEEPSPLLALLEAVDSPRFRHCFDVGHWNLFHKVGMEEWFASLGGWIAETHIHDNKGLRDDHAPPGEGTIDFALLFSLLKRDAPTAAWTIEAHSRGELERSLHNMQQYLVD
jgi:sugar phosphate isomerase/epimerase